MTRSVDGLWMSLCALATDCLLILKQQSADLAPHRVSALPTARLRFSRHWRPTLEQYVDGDVYSVAMPE